MEQHLRDYHARRIIADIYPFDYNGKIYYITYPTAEFKFYAEKVYIDVYERAKEENISADNIIVMLDKYKIWSEDEENKLTKIKQELEDTKVALYENFFRDEKRSIYKKVISDLKAEQDRLTLKKQAMDCFTAEYAASSARQKFLTGASILTYNKKRLWHRFTDWDKENKIIDTALEYIIQNYLNERDIRDLAKNDPWKTVWSLQKKPQSIFRKSVGDFTSEQQSLSIWSIVYDNIRKSIEQPSESLIEDDDALDGWMIIQKRKADVKSGQTEVKQQITNEKISKAGEIFVMANSHDQIKKVYEMNDFGSKMAFKKRMMQIQRDKIVDEVNMIETRERLVMEANNLYAKGLRDK